MKIMVKGESDPARALHRIADYISENYPEGTVLPGSLSAYFNLYYSGEYLDRELEITITGESGGVEVSSKREEAKKQAVNNLEDLWKNYQQTLDRELEKHNYQKILADRYIENAEKKIAHLEGDLRRIGKEKPADQDNDRRSGALGSDASAWRLEMNAWEKRYRKVASEKAGVEERLKRRRLNLIRIGEQIRWTQDKMVLYHALKDTSYRERIRPTSGNQNFPNGWSVQFMFDYNGRTVFFDDSTGMPELWIKTEKENRSEG